MELNEKSVREKYKEFYGRNTEQMELLVKDKRIPLGVKDIIERRLNSKQDAWQNNYFDTCDAFVYGENGKFKIVKNCKILKDMNKNTKLIYGAIKITKAEYSKLKGREFSKEDKENIWKYLLKEHYEKYIKLMGYIPDIYFDDESLTIRAAGVGRLGNWSRLVGNNDLDYDGGRLVGLASEMLGGQNG